MKILVVEDDSFKMDAIMTLIADFAGATRITTATSLHGAMMALEAATFDFVVLDMAIPSHTSDVGAIDTYSQPVGGLDVLLFVALNKRAEKVAVLTQYPTVEYDRKHVPLKNLVGVLHAEGVANLVDVILFGEDGSWKPALRAAMGAMA